MPYRIAIGSCSHPSLPQPQPLWPIIQSRQPAAFVWGGDAIYADVFQGLNWTAVGISRVVDNNNNNIHNLVLENNKENNAEINNDDNNDEENGPNTNQKKPGKSVSSSSWRLTFPPPSIHLDATPDIIRSWYKKQWDIQSYQSFVMNATASSCSSRMVSTASSNDNNNNSINIFRPLIFGTIDDHDYGSNNGDLNYPYKRESNLAFMDFLYLGVPDNDDQDGNDHYDGGTSGSTSEEESTIACTTTNGDNGDENEVCTTSCNEKRCVDKTEMESNHKSTKSQTNQQKSKRRTKVNDPVYKRAFEGKGVYGVHLFDFSRKQSQTSSTTRQQQKKIAANDILWGGGFWVSEEEALIDPDVISQVLNSRNNNANTNENNHHSIPSSNYSTTHSVAVFVLDVRSNKTPWPKGKSNNHNNANENQHICNSNNNNNNIIKGDSATMSNDGFSNSIPEHDFLGHHQWKWFQSALANSNATLNIIVSGMQIHPQRFPNDGNIVEEWSKFPEAQQLLYNVILNSGVKSPLLVSGDVHMSQFLRKECVRSRDVWKYRHHDDDDHGYESDDSSTAPRNRIPPIAKRPLIEVTTSGMTHSWGTSFSSQPKHHTWPLWPYSYFVSRTFMTLSHYVNPWREVIIRSVEDVEREENEKMMAQARRSYDDGKPKIVNTDNGKGRSKATETGGKIGKQYELGLNFGEFEFEFWDGQEECIGNDASLIDDVGNHDCNGNDAIGGGGAVTVRIFGRQENEPPKLESRWTFDQLSGAVNLPGMTAKVPQDFLSAGQLTMPRKRHGIHDHMNTINNKNPSMNNDWICVPYRGIAPTAHGYVANATMFLAFCFLFFLPYIVIILVVVMIRRRRL